MHTSGGNHTLINIKRLLYCLNVVNTFSYNDRTKHTSVVCMIHNDWKTEIEKKCRWQMTQKLNIFAIICFEVKCFPNDKTLISSYKQMHTQGTKRRNLILKYIIF